MQKGSHLDKAMEATKSRVLGCVTSFGVVQCVMLGFGQFFANLLDQMHESGNEASFMLSQATHAVPQH